MHKVRSLHGILSRAGLEHSPAGPWPKVPRALGATWVSWVGVALRRGPPPQPQLPPPSLLPPSSLPPPSFSAMRAHAILALLLCATGRAAAWHTKPKISTPCERPPPRASGLGPATAVSSALAGARGEGVRAADWVMGRRRAARARAGVALRPRPGLSSSTRRPLHESNPSGTVEAPSSVLSAWKIASPCRCVSSPHLTSPHLTSKPHSQALPPPGRS
jgi:hypothetical protein